MYFAIKKKIVSFKQENLAITYCLLLLIGQPIKFAVRRRRWRKVEEEKSSIVGVPCV